MPPQPRLAATVLDDLPDELLHLCLAWLPLHCIAAAKSVCKRWYAAAEAPYLYDIRKALGRAEPWAYTLSSRYERGCYKGLQGYMHRLAMDAERGGNNGDPLDTDNVDNDDDDDDPHGGDGGGDDEGVAMADGGGDHSRRRKKRRRRRPVALLQGPHRLQFAATASADGRLLYIVGGRSPFVCKRLDSWLVFPRVDVYDPIFNRWHEVKPMKIARYACTMASFMDKRDGILEPRLIVAGGYNMDGLALDSAEIYDPKRDEWEVLPSMKRVTGACKSAIFQDKFYVKMANNGLDAVEVYDLLLKTWSITTCQHEIISLAFHNPNETFNGLGSSVILCL